MTGDNFTFKSDRRNCAYTIVYVYKFRYKIDYITVVRVNAE